MSELSEATERRTLEEIKDALVFVVIETHGWDVNRKLGDDDYETLAAKELTAASKNLTKDPRYKAIRQIVRATDRWLEDIEVRVKFGGPGSRAIPVARLEEVVDGLEERRTAYFEAVETFIAALPEIKAKASLPKSEGGLGPLYDERQWPTAADIKSRFEFEWSVEERLTPSAKPGISSRTVERERDKLRKKWEGAADTIETGLFTELAKLVSKLAERCTDDKEKGKARIFQYTTVENLRDFLELLRDRNVTGSKRLEEIATRCEKLLEGTDAQ